MFTQYIGQHVVCMDVQFWITLSGLHLRREPKLCLFDAVDQGLKFSVTRSGIRARDVAGVAAALAPASIRNERLCFGGVRSKFV